MFRVLDYQPTAVPTGLYLLWWRPQPETEAPDVPSQCPPLFRRHDLRRWSTPLLQQSASHRRHAGWRRFPTANGAEHYEYSSVTTAAPAAPTPTGQLRCCLHGARALIRQAIGVRKAQLTGGPMLQMEQ